MTYSFRSAQLDPLDYQLLKSWAHRAANGLKVEVSERRHMVTITLGDRSAQWWPETGRTVLDRRTKRARFIDTAKDLIRELNFIWGLA